MREPEPPDFIDCRECGRQFDLNSQYYYDNVCPVCIREKDKYDEERAWPGCIDCAEKIDPDGDNVEWKAGGVPAHKRCPEDA